MAITRRTVLAASLAAPTAALAQAGFPSRPITWMNPSAPGGVLDVAGRLIAQKMTEVLGQQVLVENRPGAGGVPAAEACLRQPHDGHAMFFGNFATFAIVPLIIPNISYDATRDFQPVNGIGASFNLVLTGADRPWKTLDALIAFAKANPERVTYAAGTGSGQHAAAALFAHATGTKLTHVAYRDFAQMMNDVSAGRVDLFFDYPLSSLPHVRDGKVRALAINAPERLVIAPEIPTTGELGVKGAELYGWSGIYVPSAVPQPVVAMLAAATVKALRTPEVRKLFDDTGTVLWDHMDAAKMRTALAEEIPRMKELIGTVGATR